MDGEIHNTAEAQEYDNQRTDYLESLGYNVLRFENKIVFDNLKSVFIEIKAGFGWFERDWILMGCIVGLTLV